MEIKWIPVSERLPETSEPVLATITTPGFERALAYQLTPEIGIVRFDGEWEFWNDTQWDSLLLTNVRVLAWSPLPEPYKEGE